jgi:hypothetical protein
MILIVTNDLTIPQGNVNLICIGIGLHPNAVNNVMSIANSSIFVHDFTEMNLVVSRLSVKPGNPPKLNVRTRSSRQASFDIVSSVQFTLADVQGLEEGSNEWIVLSSAQSNVAWVKGLRPNTMFKLRAKIQTGAGWSAWSKEVELRTLRGSLCLVPSQSSPLNLPKFFRQSRDRRSEESATASKSS